MANFMKHIQVCLFMEACLDVETPHTHAVVEAKPENQCWIYVFFTFQWTAKCFSIKSIKHLHVLIV